MKKHKRQATVGSSLDDFLAEQGIYEKTKNVAIKRILSWLKNELHQP